MAELITVARPYAQAVFKRAKETGRLAEWSAMLQFAAAVAADPMMCQEINSTRHTRAELGQLFVDVCGEQLDEEGRNLMRLLAQYRRLALLPEVAAAYEMYRAEAERTIDAEVISAYPLTDAQRERLAEALAARLGRTVNLHTSTDTSLLGGAVVRAGDMVIDGSTRGKLAKLAAELSH